MKLTIQILGHAVEYECSHDDVNVNFIQALIVAGIRKGERGGVTDHNYHNLLNATAIKTTVKWRIVEPRVVEIKDCLTCPFIGGSPNYFSCDHPDYDRGMKYDQEDCFKHCPLKTQAVTIKLKTDE